jgi:hypothetical protein
VSEVVQILSLPAVVLTVHFPRGKLPVQGYRCPEHGYELIDPVESSKLERTAESLGLYEPQLVLTRKVTKSGGQLAVYIPKDVQRLLNLRQGTTVRVYVQGDRMVVEPTQT